MKEIPARKMILALAGMILSVLLLFTGCSKAAETEAESEPSTPQETEEVFEAEEEGEDASDSAAHITYLNYEFTDTRNGYAVVKNQSGLLYGVVDHNGNQVIDFKYDNLKFLDVPGKNYLQANYEGKNALIDCDGTQIVPFDKGDFRVMNGKTILRIYEYDIAQYGQVSVERERQGFEIYDVDGNLLREYRVYQEHPTQGDYASLDFVNIGDIGFIVSGAASSVNGSQIHVDRFMDIIEADGSVIETNSSDDIVYSATAAWNPSDDTYSVSVIRTPMSIYPNTNDLAEVIVFDESGNILNRSVETYEILAWTRNGYALVHDLNSNYRLINVDSGETIGYWDSKPDFQISNSLCVVGNDILDNDGNLLFTVQDNPILLNDKILYTTTDTNTTRLVDADNEPVMDDRYFGCFTLETNGHQAYFLENGNSEVLLISKSGEVLADYGTFTTSGSSDDPSFRYNNNGSTVQDYRVTDESLSLWFYDSYLTFFYL